MENMENTLCHHNCQNSQDTPGGLSYSFEGQEKCTKQEQYELKVYLESTEAKSYQEDEVSAVDLRMSRFPSKANSLGGNIAYRKNEKDAISIVPFFKNVNSNGLRIFNISSDSEIENPIENGNNNISNIESYKDNFNQVSHNTSYQKIDPQKMYTLKKNCFNGPELNNVENDYVLLVDQETQTQIKEFKEASVQTDKDSSHNCAYSLLRKKNLSNLNYSCLSCQRFYASKSSYLRHVRTHLNNGNFLKNLHVTKKAELMVLEVNFCKGQSVKGLPMTLQEPKVTTFQCGICYKSFSSEVARDAHRGNFVCEEFLMTKCKECHVKFVTFGALQEHVKFVHERNTKCNAYCCVFCNASFQSSYCFQLHLDEHLATKISC